MKIYLYGKPDPFYTSDLYWISFVNYKSCPVCVSPEHICLRATKPFCIYEEVASIIISSTPIFNQGNMVASWMPGWDKPKVRA